MFCKNCGNELKEGAKFCPICGNPVGNLSEEEPPVQSQGQQQEQSQRREKTVKRRKSKLPMILAISLAGVLAVGAGVFAAVKIKGSNDPSETAAKPLTVEASIPEENKVDSAAQSENKDANADSPAESQVEAGTAQGSTGVQIENPGEFIETLYQGLMIDHTITPEVFWDDYVSDRSKNLGVIDRDGYLNLVAEDPMVIQEVSASQGAHVGRNEELYKVKVMQKIVDETGAQQSRYLEEYVVVENGYCKYLVYGIYEAETFAELTTTNGLFKVKNLEVDYCAEGISLRYNLYNNSEQYIRHGWIGGPTVQLVTSEDTYEAELDEPHAYDPQGEFFEQLYCEKAEGTLQEIQFDNMFVVDANGNPQEVSDGETYTLMLRQ